MIHISINKRVVETRFIQLILLCVIGGIIAWGATLPWWDIWVGYILLIGTGIGIVLTSLVIAIGHLSDRLKMGA